MSTEPKPKESTWSMIRSFVYAVLLALVFRSFAYEPFHIPSGSMLPTLRVGDYIFVSKLSYGYSRYSFPFGVIIPYFDDRILKTEPERGDVIVFRLPKNPSIDYIKRLVGLPGDTIRVVDGLLYINDKPVKLKKIDDYQEKLEDGSIKSVRRYVETLPNGVKHWVLDERPYGNMDPTGFDSDNTGTYVVPADHYFFMGDNRDNSVDSRYAVDGPSYVPAENLVGHAQMIFVSFNQDVHFYEFWRWPWGFNHDRWVTYVN